MASETKKALPKGILKKPSNSDAANGGAVASPSPAAVQKRRTRTPDPREVAIQHAKIIHDRRLLEETITDSIILLAKLPNTLPDPPSAVSSSPAPSSSTTTTTTPSPTPTPTPTPTAADLFKSHVRLFQPSDYDALIEERNALGLCGYCLCPRPRQQLGGRGGPYKILNWGRADFAIAPRAEVERWCSFRPNPSSSSSSSSCARRAMYVKVQLGETAAFERAGIDSIRIELLEEVEEEQQQQQRQRQREREKGEEESQEDGKRKTQEDTEKQKQLGSAGDADAAKQAARDLENLRLAEETDRKQKAARDAKDLALERGDTDAKKAAKRSVNVTIREKRVVTTVHEPSAGGSSEAHLVLDGYKTKKFNPKTPEAVSRRGTTAPTTTTTSSTDAPVKEAESSAADKDEDE